MANQVLDDEDELTEDEQQRRLAAQQTIGSMPRHNPYSQSIPADMPAPDVGAASQPPGASTIAGVAPYNPPSPAAPRPQSQAFTDWQAQDLAKHPVGQPRYHGLARVADTIAGVTNIGRTAEEVGEFGSLGAQTKANRLAHNSELENEQIGYGEKERQQEAQTAEQEAKVETEKKGAEVQQISLPGGGTVGVMTKNVGTPTAAIINSAERGQAATTDANAKTDVAGMNIDANASLVKAKTDLANAQADLARFKADPNSPMYKIALEHLKLATDAYGLKLKEFGFNYEPSILTPEEQGTLPTDISGNTVGLHSPLKPTGQTVNAAQRAQNVVSQIPRFTKEIQTLQNQLGPGVGRWNRFWQGDVGVASPEFAHLADDMDFMASAVALAHAYGRLPTSISEKFDRMYQAGKQDPANMLAAMQVAGEWLPRIAQGGQTSGEKAGGAGGAGAPNAPPTGPKRFKDFVQGQ